MQLGNCEIVFSSPERWLSKDWRKELRNGKLGSQTVEMALDEVHSVTEWYVRSFVFSLLVFSSVLSHTREIAIVIDDHAYGRMMLFVYNMRAKIGMVELPGFIVRFYSFKSLCTICCCLPFWNLPISMWSIYLECQCL